MNTQNTDNTLTGTLPGEKENKAAAKLRSFFAKAGKLFSRLDAPFSGMRHMWLAFILPMAVMALIYIAMEVWPFGKSSVLVLDLNGQYVYYFEALRDILRGEQGILYSFERALGGEFLGIVAYYLASPLSVIVALFPEGHITEALYTILLLKCGLSGMNMCIYLHKSHPTKPVNEVVFSLMYALCSYGVVMQHNTMWFDCFLLLPLIFLGVEELIKYGHYKLYVITLAVAVCSNYYIGYMVCIAVAAYFFFCYGVCTASERNPLGERRHFLKTFGRMAFFSLIAVGIASILILPAYYSLTFGKTTFSNPNYSFSQKFDFLDLISKLYPASYDTVRPEGWPFVFSGTLTTILLPIFFMTGRITPRKKIAFGLLVGFFVFSFNSSTIDLVWHGFQRPNWLNYRYSFIFCFVIVLMAYMVFEFIREIEPKMFLSVGAVLGLLICIIQKLDYKNAPDLMCVWFSIAAIAVYMIILAGCHHDWLDGAVNTILCVAVLPELFGSGLADVISLDKDVHYSSRASYVNFMNVWTPAANWVNEHDTAFYRAEKTEHRKTNDNFTLNLRGLSNSTSTLNAAQIKFLEQMGYSSKSHWSKYLGGTPVSDSLLGIKYLLSYASTEQNDLWGEPVWSDEEHETVVYRNEYALSVGYMVGTQIADYDMEKQLSPMDRMNDLLTKMTDSSEKLTVFKSYKNIKPTLENVELSYVTGHKKYAKTNTSRAGKLTFTFTAVNDGEIFAYFPSEYKRDAKLKVNGSDVSEYFTNETCRIVSLGKHSAGEEVIVTLNLSADDLYLANGCDFFWYIAEELFKKVMPTLAGNGFEISEFTDSSFEGRITATEDKPLFLLTIPFDEGWHVSVDGEEVETFEVLGSLTGIELEPGEHTISMRYFPWAVKYGLIISGCSLAIFVIVVAVEFIIKRRRPVVRFCVAGGSEPEVIVESAVESVPETASPAEPEVPESSEPEVLPEKAENSGDNIAENA